MTVNTPVEIPVMPCVSCSQPSIGRVAATKNGGSVPVWRMKCRTCMEAVTGFLCAEEPLPVAKLPAPIAQRRYDGPRPHAAVPSRPLTGYKPCKGCGDLKPREDFPQKRAVGGRARGRSSFCPECVRTDRLENT